MSTSPYIHPVPVGATIPAGTKYAFVTDRNSDLTQEDGDDLQRFTAEPVPAPRPAPPTEPGTVLADVHNVIDTCAAMIFFNGEWHGVDQCGDYRFWQTADLVSWTVAEVVPRTADPLDESDHRDRIVVGRTTDRRLPLVRHGCKDWRTPGVTSGDPLKDWHGRYGWDVRFADGAALS